MYGRSTPRRKPAWLPLLTGVLLCALMLVVAMAAGGCGADSAGTDAGFATVTDDNGDVVTIPAEPQSIVSTSSAATQILFALGAGDRVVGVNQWDDYLPEVADIPKVADLSVNVEAVVALSPDLVLGAAGQEEALAIIEASGASVLILDPTTIEGIYTDMAMVGMAVGVEEQAATAVQTLREAFADLSEAAATASESPSVFYAIDDVLSTFGPGSFMDELLALASATNVASTEGAPDYYQFTPELLVAADPDMVILNAFYGGVDKFTSDPRFAGLTAVKEGRVYELDAEADKLLTLAGPRIVEGFAGLVKTIHPGMSITQ